MRCGGRYHKMFELPCIALKPMDARIRSRVDAKLPELRFRALLTEAEPELELALV